MKVLVVDIGGSHVKMLATGRPRPRRFDSSKHLTPDQLVKQVQKLTADWKYNAITLGYPGAVGPKGPLAEPGNLGDGWINFNFEKAFGHPVRFINDAAMQALGAYRGGRMLFLGLGTGVGSALVADRVVFPLELGELPSGHGSTLFARLSKRSLKRKGKRAWRAAVTEAARILHRAFAVDYIVLGGGNAKLVKRLPAHVRRGHNNDAFTGGFRLWEERFHLHKKSPTNIWRVIC